VSLSGGRGTASFAGVEQLRSMTKRTRNCAATSSRRAYWRLVLSSVAVVFVLVAIS
jgi:hypothetical protein